MWIKVSSRMYASLISPATITEEEETSKWVIEFLPIKKLHRKKFKTSASAIARFNVVISELLQMVTIQNQVIHSVFKQTFELHFPNNQVIKCSIYSACSDIRELQELSIQSSTLGFSKTETSIIVNAVATSENITTQFIKLVKIQWLNSLTHNDSETLQKALDSTN